MTQAGFGQLNSGERSTKLLPLLTCREQKTLVEDEPWALPATCPDGGLQGDAAGSWWFASGSWLHLLLPTGSLPCSFPMRNNRWQYLLMGFVTPHQGVLFAHPSPYGSCCAMNHIRELTSPQ